MSLPRKSSFTLAQPGFTLIELMVVIAIAAILLIVGIPSFQAIINSNRLTSAANEMVAAIQTARADAIRYNKRTEVCLSLNSNTANPTCAPDNTTTAKGWIVFVDLDKSGAYNVGDRLLRVANVHEAVTVIASPALINGTKVVFRSDGLARTTTGLVLQGTVDMCIASGKNENIRHVSIRGGSVSVIRATAAGACVAPANLS
ncbi:MAG: GspH/FimT family pseudopilin [Betaproteobacteria bacterium]